MKEAYFHKEVGGRKRRDLRFAETIPAFHIRSLIFQLRKKRPELNNAQIADLLNISSSTLSMAAGGRAGTRINETGQSTTQAILNGLINLNKEL